MRMGLDSVNRERVAWREDYANQLSVLVFHEGHTGGAEGSRCFLGKGRERKVVLPSSVLRTGFDRDYVATCGARIYLSRGRVVTCVAQTGRHRDPGANVGKCQTTRSRCVVDHVHPNDRRVRRGN